MTAESSDPSPESQAQRLHRAGCAWTDRGTQGLVLAGDWAAAVACHQRAVELLGSLPVDGNSSYLADLGAAWVNLGCALQAGPSRESLEEALDALDRGVELLGKLPLGGNPRFRHNLAAAWMNRADVCARIGTAASQAAALGAYRRAIEVAGELPLDEKASFRVLLASCWINLGNLHLSLSDFSDAVGAYDRALAAIGGLPRSGHRLACHHAATAWANRGEAFLAATTGDGDRQAVESAKMALAQVEGRDLGGPVDAKLGMRALRVLARALESVIRREPGGSADRIAQITDVAERGLDLAFGGHEGDPQFFDPFVVWFFSFGSRAYARHQPQFLREFLDEGLGRWDCDGNPGIRLELHTIARRSAAAALEGLGRGRLIVAGSRQTELLLSTANDLRTAAFQFDS